VNKYPSYADGGPAESKNQYDAQPGTNQPFNLKTEVRAGKKASFCPKRL